MLMLWYWDLMLTGSNVERGSHRSHGWRSGLPGFVDKEPPSGVLNGIEQGLLKLKTCEMTGFFLRTLSQVVAMTNGGPPSGRLYEVFQAGESRCLMLYGWGSVAGSLAPLGHLGGEKKCGKNVVWDPREVSQCCDAFGYDMTRMRGGTEITAQRNAHGRCKAKPGGLGSFSGLDRRDAQGQALHSMDQRRLVRMRATNGLFLYARYFHG
ncbi:hypothetical protein GOP47_0000102 [Adiantum capillus-veneris]|uniref:Uncharacterized protein n=1 Tax=Adiantum capillus-veneris TaxID=13818 RepID=A0A9D4ZQE2_ADICA|nr:hypothetical protein GOP47_0000102 [Adiantum capillus-veneris]